MTQPFIFTAEQANTLNTTGHLEGFKELCEWQPPEGAMYASHSNVAYRYKLRGRGRGRWHVETLTPTRAVGQVYAVRWSERCKPPLRGFAIKEGHAKIATEPTLSIHEGKLVWTYDLVKE